MTKVDAQTSERMSAALTEWMKYVGHIASGWAALEHQADQAIWRLSDVEQALGACITSQLGGIHARFRVLLALLNLREGSEPFIDKINKFSGKIYPTLEKRNRAVHDAWSVNETGEVAQLRVALVKGHLKLDAVLASENDMRDTLKAVRRHVGEFNTIFHEISTWLDASPQKWREPLPGMSLGRLGGATP